MNTQNKIATSAADPASHTKRLKNLNDHANRVKAQSKHGVSDSFNGTGCEGTDDSDFGEPLIFWRPLILLVCSFFVELILKWVSYTWPTRFTFLSIPNFSGGTVVTLGWTYSENYGSAFGIFSDQNLWVRVAVHVLCTLIVIGVAILTMSWRCKWEFKVGLYCYMIGGLGNLVDRWTVGFVVDYFYVRSYFTPRDLAFNISDLVINAGFVFLVAACVSQPFDDDDEETSLAATSADPSAEPSVELSAKE